jgi:hypothetical protein
MKLRLLLFSICFFLLACQTLPPGDYDVYPRTGVVTPATVQYSQGNDTWTFYLHGVRPSNTPSFPDVYATPTPDNSPITAVPSTIPIKVCTAWVAERSGIKVRTGPGTSYSWIDLLKINTHKEVFEFKETGGYLWAKIDSGWMAVRDSQRWWVAWENPENCLDLPGYPIEGIHLTMNVNSGALSPIFIHLGVIKATSMNGYILATAKYYNPLIITIYRSTRYPDCPPDNYSATQWLNLVSTDWPVADYYEITNECVLSSDRWNSFNIEAMQWANQRGKCLLLFSFSVGHPDLLQWKELKPTFDYAQTHPCMNKLHGIATHSYTSGSTIQDEYLFARFNRLAVILNPLLPWYLTEVGDDPQTTGNVNCVTWLAFSRQVKTFLLNIPLIDGYALWNVGYGTGWIDATSCLTGL